MLWHHIGYVGLVVPAYVKNNMGIIALEKDHHGRPYVDNLCLFRCLGLHLGHDANTHYAKYTGQPVERFEGVTIDELHKVESLSFLSLRVSNAIFARLAVRYSFTKIIFTGSFRWLNYFSCPLAL